MTEKKKPRTTAKAKARAAIKKWFEKTAAKKAKAIDHIFPLAYVIGRSAPGCLVVAVPWIHAREHLAEFVRDNPLHTIHVFDKSLDAGMWCTVAYVVAEGSSENVAIKVVR